MNISKNTIKRINLLTSDKVSVIITNYKKEKRLKYAIRSVKNQIYKNLEIIVIDDNSNRKKSLNIARQLNDGRIRYIYTKVNYGHYACANYAMDLANGKYITFLGADDTMSPDHIGNLLKAITSFDLRAVCSRREKYDLNGNLLSSGILCEASILFPKKLLNYIGYFHMVRFGADSEFRNRIIKKYGKNKFGLLNLSTYKATLMPNSLTSSYITGKKSLDRTNYIRDFKNNFKKNNLFFDYKNEKMKFGLDSAIAVKNFNTKYFREVEL